MSIVDMHVDAFTLGPFELSLGTMPSEEETVRGYKYIPVVDAEMEVVCWVEPEHADMVLLALNQGHKAMWEAKMRATQ